jgi:Mrp family chromosome partitioning ATPase
VYERRITVLVGSFGSGKTEIALNGALALAAAGGPVTLADLDVVKPYFRSRAARAILDEAGIRLLAPAGEVTHSDLPIVVPQVRAALRDPSCRVVVDAGGDDVGARVLGSLSDVLPVADAHVLVVLNFRRPSTPDAEKAAAMVRKIEAAARVKVTGLVSNTHLMRETTPRVVLEGHQLAVEAAEDLGIPVIAVTATSDVAADLAGEELGCPLVVLQRIVLPPFEQPPQTRTMGPLFVVN